MPHSISSLPSISCGIQIFYKTFPHSRTVWLHRHSEVKYYALKSASVERIPESFSAFGSIGYNNEFEGDALPLSSQGEVVEKLQNSLQSKFGISMTENGFQNIQTLVSLRAKPHQIRRIFNSNTRFFEDPFHSQIHSKILIFDKFGMSVNVVLQALTKNSEWLLSPDEQVSKSLAYLERELAVTNISRVVCRSPKILSLTATQLDDSVSNLSALDLCDVGSAIERNPSLLGCDKRMMQTLIDTVGVLMESANPAHLIELNPTLLSSHPESMRTMYNEFLQRFERDLCKEIFQRHPKLLGENFMSIQETVDCTIDRFGMKPAAHMILSCPVFIRRKWESLQKKIDYIVRDMGRSNEDIVQWTPVLALSLQKRLVVRSEALRDLPNYPHFKLRYIFACNDGEFQRRFRVQLPSDNNKKSSNSSSSPSAILNNQ